MQFVHFSRCMSWHNLWRFFILQIDPALSHMLFRIAFPKKECHNGEYTIPSLCAKKGVKREIPMLLNINTDGPGVGWPVTMPPPKLTKINILTIPGPYPITALKMAQTPCYGPGPKDIMAVE